MSFELLTPSSRGVRLRVRLTPKASGNSVSGIEEGPNGPVLAVRVQAIADKGKANAALVKVLAGWAVLPQGDINLVSGHKSRFKTIEILGNQERLMEQIGLLLTDLDDKKS